jgi:hypothetical protein
MSYDDRITKKAQRGEHIKLTCKNHPDLEWSTKNIDYIGARSIFFNLFNRCNSIECPCKLDALVLHPSYKDMPDID